VDCCLHERIQISRVVFTGNFLRCNRIALQTVSYSLSKWSELSSAGKDTPRTEALFLKHEGYFGAVGAFLANHANAAGEPCSNAPQAPFCPCLA
jgi:type II pantothenate kinase